jgi:hypothetical protein
MSISTVGDADEDQALARTRNTLRSLMPKRSAIFAFVRPWLDSSRTWSAFARGSSCAGGGMGSDISHGFHIVAAGEARRVFAR